MPDRPVPRASHPAAGSDRPASRPGPPAGGSAPRLPRTAAAEPAVVCERCGAAMFRMHAVWRCPGCGFKTDCCGW